MQAGMLNLITNSRHISKSKSIYESLSCIGTRGTAVQILNKYSKKRTRKVFDAQHGHLTKAQQEHNKNLQRIQETFSSTTI